MLLDIESRRDIFHSIICFIYSPSPMMDTHKQERCSWFIAHATCILTAHHSSFNEIWKNCTDWHEWLLIRMNAPCNAQKEAQTRKKSLKISVLFETRCKIRHKTEKSAFRREYRWKDQKEKSTYRANSTWHATEIVSRHRCWGVGWFGWHGSHIDVGLGTLIENAKRGRRFHLPPYYFKFRFLCAARTVLYWSGIWNL